MSIFFKNTSFKMINLHIFDKHLEFKILAITDISYHFCTFIIFNGKYVIT